MAKVMRSNDDQYAEKVMFDGFLEPCEPCAAGEQLWTASLR